MKVTVEVVAKHAGVSRATAARILGGYAGARTKSREKVLAVAKELGYFPNKLARGLASSRSFKIGIIIPDIENLFFAKLYRGIESICHTEGFSLVLRISGEDEKREQAVISDLLSEQVEGIIIAPSNGLKELPNVSVPIISADRIPDSTEHSWISTNNYESSYTAVEHLQQRGYKDIAFITDLPHLSTIKERCAGVEDAVAKFQLSFTAYTTSSHQLDHIIFEVKDFLLVKRPQAVIVTDSVICTAVLLATRELGIQLGTDLGLIAYDDEPWMSLMSPSITTIKQPVVQMGEESAKLLLDQLSASTTTICTKRLSNELVIRESTNPKRMVMNT